MPKKKTFREKMLDPKNRRSSNVVDRRIEGHKRTASGLTAGAKRLSKEVKARTKAASKNSSEPNRAKLLHAQVGAESMVKASQKRGKAKMHKAKASKISQNYKRAALSKRLRKRSATTGAKKRGR